MNKILLVLTGGTIGSTAKNGIIRANDTNCRVLALYREAYGNDTDFEVVSPLNILSENLDKSHWETLVRFITQQKLEEYCGIIVTHGSDTLSYTSAFLGAALQHLPVPVILTAADYVPDDPRSNALQNLRACVTLLQNVRQGVFTVWKNSGDTACSVFIAERIQEADRFFDRFSSPDGEPYGYIENDSLRLCSSAAVCRSVQQKSPLYNGRLSLDKNVLMIRPYPSLNYKSIAVDENTGAVLHLTYHSATAKTDGDNSALTLLRHCREAGIPMYLAAFKPQCRSVYETSDVLIKNGAIPLCNITDEAAYARVLIACNTGNQLAINSFILTLS